MVHINKKILIKKPCRELSTGLFNERFNYFAIEPSFTLLLLASTKFVALNSTTMLSVNA